MTVEKITRVERVTNVRNLTTHPYPHKVGGFHPHDAAMAPPTPEVVKTEAKKPSPAKKAPGKVARPEGK